MKFPRLMFRAWLILSGLWVSAVFLYPLILALIDKSPLQASTDPEPWIALLVMVLADNFRREDHSGWAKAGWTLFVIFVPLIGVLAYMIARPKQDLEVA